MVIINEILALALTAAPWLIVGLVVAGLVKAFLAESKLRRWVGRPGLVGISRAAIVGAPLPLCSCGAIPTAVTLYRGGAGRGPTTAFLIGTPGVGVDSVAITYALLGPFMALARILGAVMTAVATGLLVTLRWAGGARAGGGIPETRGDGCCGNSDAAESGCGSGDCAATSPVPDGLYARLGHGMRYAFNELYDDISRWLLIGLVLAGTLAALVPPQTLAGVGNGPWPILVMAFVGVPLYICASAATPVAAGLLMAGVSPGAVITFLLAGPVTSLATLGVLRREMGTRAVGVYLAGIVTATVVVGFGVNGIVSVVGIDIAAQVEKGATLLPRWVSVAALAALVGLTIAPLRRRMFDYVWPVQGDQASA